MTFHQTTLTSVLLLAAVSALRAEGSAESAELRKKALQFIQPLPDKMPGAEKDTAERIALGKRLFFEKKLSQNSTQSCNSCHAVDNGHAGVDNEATSPGAFGKRGDRNSPSVFNAGFHFAQFWDARAGTLEDQAKGPILNPGEMAMPGEAEVVTRLSADDTYSKEFATAFPGEEKPLTYDNLAKAIASFERTLRTHDRFDDFLKGDDKALNADEHKGLKLFLDTGCITCHMGPAIGGNMLQKMGLQKPYTNAKDTGRAAHTKNEAEKFLFKVPSLRNVALTHPYFHDGGTTKLEEAVGTMADIQLGRTLNEEDRKAIATFLRSLTDKTQAAAAEKPAAK